MANSNKGNQPQYPYWPPYSPGWGRGWRGGWGPGWGYGWGRCFRFPWLPRWWWADPEYWQQFGVPQPTPKEEKEMLNEELKALREEMKVIEERIKELETKKAKK